MNSWIDTLVDKKKLTSIFNDEEPSLYNVDIHDVIFHRDGPRISIRFNLRDYPSSPPKKWKIQKYNTVQLQLTAIDVKDVKLSGWSKTKYLVSLNVSMENGFVCIRAKDDVFELYIKASFLDVSSVSAYLRSK
ncbi:Imm50 family immunity protein [Citrobacter sp. ESBL3]|uniref:Imm50 family immunity protein n=1 Tax=Citrobacter sp. ESBL3 TaxID=3077326 RepID=UPI002FCB2175